MRWNVSHLEIVLRNNLTFGPSQGRNQLFFSCGGQNDWLVVVPDSETCFWKFWGSCSPPKSTAGYDYPLHSCGPGPSTRTIIPYATGGKAFKVGALLWQRSCFKRTQMRAQQKKQSLRKKLKNSPRLILRRTIAQFPLPLAVTQDFVIKGFKSREEKF